jgi:hypothetical protein
MQLNVSTILSPFLCFECYKPNNFSNETTMYQWIDSAADLPEGLIPIQNKNITIRIAIADMYDSDIYCKNEPSYILLLKPAASDLS